MLTAAQAAAELKIHVSRVIQLIDAGRLKAHKFGRQWAIDPRDLKAVRVRNEKRGPKPKSK